MSADPALDRIRVLYRQLNKLSPRNPAYAPLVHAIQAEVKARAAIVGDEMVLVSAHAPPDEDDRTPRRIHRRPVRPTPFDDRGYGGRLRMAKASLESR